MNKIFATLLSLAVAASAGAKTVTDFFKDAVASNVITLLDKNTRMDMVDYFAHGMSNASVNRLDGSSRIVSANDNVMVFELTSDIKCQLAMLTAKTDTVLMLIETVHLPQSDSRLSFYTKEWKPLERDLAAQPVLTDWLSDRGKKERSQVENWLPFMLAEAEYKDGTLTFTTSLHKYYVDEEDVENLTKWLVPQLSYTYNGTKFVRKK